MKSFSDFLIPSLCIVLIIVSLYLLGLLFEKISNIYVSKNKTKLFNLHKKVFTELKNEGNKISEDFLVYIQYIEYLGLNKIIRCSNSVVSNSKNDPIKYILKYSKIEKDNNSLERLDFILSFIKNYTSFIKKMEKMKPVAKKDLPFFFKIFINKKRLPYMICDLNYDLSGIKLPYLCFLYISPAGKSRDSNLIKLTEQNLSALTEQIYIFINKKGSSKAQRNIMTNDLREAIKKRDNYTCCKCGNSVYDEPNLLLEVDHIIPISKGGKTEANNLQTLCWRCNRAKGDKESF